MNIRSLQAADFPALLRIEQDSLTDPWSEEQLVAEMHASNGVNFVAERDNLVCGAAFFRICTPESDLLRLAVAPEWRNQGVGSALLAHALHSFSRQGFESCFLEVRCSNEEARRLYQKAGFLQIGIRKRYYKQPVEDAMQLCKNLKDMRGVSP